MQEIYQKVLEQFVYPIWIWFWELDGEDWPKGEKGNLEMKICDEGSYYLLDENYKTILSIEEDYVPNKLLPGSYGDYLKLDIGENGVISNWYSIPSIEDFIDED